MKKANQLKVMAAIIAAGLTGGTEVKANVVQLPTSDNADDVKSKVSLIREYVGKNTLKIGLTSNLNELVIKDEEDNIAWAQTWTQKPDFTNAFGNFWG